MSLFPAPDTSSMMNCQNHADSRSFPASTTLLRQNLQLVGFPLQHTLVLTSLGIGPIGVEQYRH